jgi:hypothetical protein
VIGHFGARDRIFEFSQELVKICAAANNFDFHVYFGMSGRYNEPVQYGRNSAHKSRADWAVFSLGVYMTKRQHISIYFREAPIFLRSANIL